jgi:hypothetical protein
MPSPLHLDVFVAPYKPIVGLIDPMGEGDATWPATSVSLISGERDAVLIDAVLTPEDAGQGWKSRCQPGGRGRLAPARPPPRGLVRRPPTSMG